MMKKKTHILRTFLLKLNLKHIFQNSWLLLFFMCPPLETFSLQQLMSFNVKLLLYIVSERGCRLNLSLFSPLQRIICCKLS